MNLLASGNMIARLILAICSLAAFACFAIPMYVIRPYRHQGVHELAVALFLKQIGPAVSAVCAFIALLIVVMTWRRAHTWISRTVMVLLLSLAVGGAYLSRINVYELMFHHLDSPQFQAARNAHIDKDDMVLAVRLNGESRAYPIREMAYHHVVNDRVGGEPIVSTY
jgi:hypothetical protein